LSVTASPAVQHKMSEENGSRMRAESRVVEVEKQCSMLEFDLKQSVQKMEQLMKQKERLEDEVSNPSLTGSIECLLVPHFVCLVSVVHPHHPAVVPPQVKSLQIQGDQESSKRFQSQNDLKSRMQEVDRLRCSEKQLKQEINTALESKRSLEFQLAQLTK